MDYEIVIGLEVHLQLKTDSKMFCGCRNKFGAEPNTLTCPVCLGMPGILPVINKQAFDYALRAGLALNCKIDSFTKFDRKNYFYPDLPKNYQISQYDLPFAKDGWLDIKLTTDNKPLTTKRIGITRVHLEEDTGKLIHPEVRQEAGAEKTQLGYSLVDLNRAGVPLLEIVSKPEINSPEEAYAYLGALKEIMQYLEISDCDMEKGSLRCDTNLSVRPKGDKKLGTKAEIKNINSFKFVKNALVYEAKRQTELLKKGEPVIQETRLWDEKEEVTKPMRSKEEAHDYRYFPEPDLVPVIIDAKWLEEVKKNMPELPETRRKRLINQYQISEHETNVLTQEKAMADYAESGPVRTKTARNLMLGIVLQIINERKIEFGEFARKVPPENLLELAEQLDKKIIVSTMATTVLGKMLDSGKTAAEIIKGQGLEQVSDKSSLEPIIKEVIKNNAKIVADYKGGKKTAIQSLIGQVMKASRGKANPQIVKELLAKLLDN
ncbi:MAG: Asp-tRNA(Asn)/Glu-tRNA(Gln) amidotransferase subunit GatB [Planctomycetes bacterium]|nr:Asp-tRNA(Asn)/Glu-tRNA(Gln) amidotransferase subunit GatB [Planctomycetota bacterium]